MAFSIWPKVTVIDGSPRPTREFMSDTLALALAGMVTENLPEGHPFGDMTPRQQAEVCRAAHFFASLRG